MNLIRIEDTGTISEYANDEYTVKPLLLENLTPIENLDFYLNLRAESLSESIVTFFQKLRNSSLFQSKKILI